MPSSAHQAPTQSITPLSHQGSVSHRLAISRSSILIIDMSFDFRNFRTLSPKLPIKVHFSFPSHSSPPTLCTLHPFHCLPFHSPFLPLFSLLLSISTTSMSAHELRALPGNERAVSPPKHAPQGRKRLQSNADEATPKRSKATNKDGEEGSIEVEEEPVKTAATKSKDKKGKKSRCVASQYISTCQLITLW